MISANSQTHRTHRTERKASRGSASSAPKANGVPASAEASARQAGKPAGESVLVVNLPVSSLKVSPTNARETSRISSQEGISDLAESILEVGILCPLVVRFRETFYEIVAGHRRFFAASSIGLKNVPCIVRKLSDVEALELQIVENEQRADLHPMERARSFSDFLALKGPDGKLLFNVESAAQRLGRKPSAIYGALKLLSLPKEIQEHVWKGRMSASVAELVARIPGEKAQEEAAEEIIDYHETFDDAKRYIQENFMRRLKGVPFDLEDPTLSPSAGEVVYGSRTFTDMGKCSECAWRTGNMKLVSPDAAGSGSTDVCTKVSCLDIKLKVSGERKLEAVRAAAQAASGAVKPLKIPVVSVKEYDWERKDRETSDYSLSNYATTASNYVDLDAPAPGSKKSWQELAGKDLFVPFAIGVDPAHNAHRLVKKTEMAEVVKSHKVSLPKAAQEVIAARRGLAPVDPELALERKVEALAISKVKDLLLKRVSSVTFDDVAFMRAFILSDLRNSYLSADRLKGYNERHGCGLSAEAVEVWLESESSMGALSRFLLDLRTLSNVTFYDFEDSVEKLEIMAAALRLKPEDLTDCKAAAKKEVMEAAKAGEVPSTPNPPKAGAKKGGGK